MKKFYTLLLVLMSFSAMAQIQNVLVTEFSTGHNQLMQAVSIDDQTILTLERTGKCYIVKNGIKRPTPIIEITPLPSTVSEQGALSVLYRQVNGIDFVWVYWTVNASPRFGQIAFWTINVQNNASSSPTVIFDGFEATSSIHQGGQLYWMNDMLYCSFGDSNNFWNTQRDVKSNGKILELDPFNYNDTLNIYAKGLRNPFRGFLHNGWIYQGDVGAASYEELSLIKESGKNLGWPFYQGYNVYQTTIPDNPETGLPYELTNELKPLCVYSHFSGNLVTETDTFNINFTGVSIVPIGIVNNWGYNGNSIVLMDFFERNIILIDLNSTDDEVVNARNIGTDEQLFFISGGFVNANELYLTSNTGKMLKAVYDETLSLTNTSLTHENLIGYKYTVYNVIGQEIYASVIDSNTSEILKRFKGLNYVRIEEMNKTIKILN